MKAICSIFIMLFTFSALAQDVFDAYYGVDCRLEYTGSYYYVSRGGQRFTELTGSLQQALAQQAQLVNTGTCSYPAQSPGPCQLEYTGSYYYVSRQGVRFSELVSDFRAALRTRDVLYQNLNCNENTYRPMQFCQIEYTGSYYYVSRNGTRFSELVSDLNRATQTRDELAQNYVCQPKYQSSSCRLEYTGSYYYISIDARRSSELSSSLNQTIQKQRDFAGRGLCTIPRSNERCSIEFTGSYYYVARTGTRFSNLVSNVSQAESTLNELRYSQNCY